MSDEWQDAELAAAVEAYRIMQRCEAESKPCSKRKIYRDLAERFGRTDKAFEYRMQNISAVLESMGRRWLPGLRPAANVGVNIKKRLVEMLDRASETTRSSNKKLASYKKKLPAIRHWLIEVARHGGKVTYSEVMTAFGIDRFSLRHAMDYLGHQADNLDEPIITALIVSKGTGHCSIGIAKEFDIHDDGAERVRIYDYWKTAENEEKDLGLSDDLEVRAARFVSVEARPDQAAFRRRVFIACRGKCVISGCNVDKVLDAAHKKGLSWRDGYNRAEDGYLLRKDLHALYDHDLLCISEDGVVELNHEAAELGHYQHLAGTKVKA